MSDKPEMSIRDVVFRWQLRDVEYSGMEGLIKALEEREAVRDAIVREAKPPSDSRFMAECCACGLMHDCRVDSKGDGT